ncbi:hypothetical protein QUC31_012053, partial [Theobroma cacao]
QSTRSSKPSRPYWVPDDVAFAGLGLSGSGFFFLSLYFFLLFFSSPSFCHRSSSRSASLIIDYVPASSEALAELLVTIRTGLSEAVAYIMVPTWSPLVMKAEPNAALVAAYQFGMSVRLMRNICFWKEILALPVLEKLALDDLLYGKILPHVRNITSDVQYAVKRTERIVASLSGCGQAQMPHKIPGINNVCLRGHPSC